MEIKTDNIEPQISSDIDKFVEEKSILGVIKGVRGQLASLWESITGEKSESQKNEKMEKKKETCKQYYILATKEKLNLAENFNLLLLKAKLSFSGLLAEFNKQFIDNKSNTNTSTSSHVSPEYNSNTVPTNSSGFCAETGVNIFSASGMKGAGLKHNNPGNLRKAEFGKHLGESPAKFAIYATPEDGFDALLEKVKYNQTNPKSTYYGTNIQQYFQKYAPKGDGDNDPDKYAQDVASDLGVGINTPIKDLDTKAFATVIAKHDSGYDATTYGQFRSIA